jgi:two-component system heavy metal sensor histidine kinase CusS
MSRLEALLRRGVGRLRRSMTAQIGVSITLISVLLLVLGGAAVDRFLTNELTSENELTLFANLAFLRDDLASVGYDLARAPELVERVERRVNRLHAAVLDEQRHVIASSAKFPVPASALPERVLDAGSLPTGLSVDDVRAVRDQLGSPTSIWADPTGPHYRVLLGRVARPVPAGAAPQPVLVALAVATTETSELRKRLRQGLLVAPVVAAVLASLLGVWIARRILVSARDLGRAASRIGAGALKERLALDDSPTELEESRIAFNHMLDRLQSAFERLSAFSSDLAHDLRTPVNILLGEAQVALSRPRSAEEYRAVLESSVEEYERLSRMIGNMLFLAQADNDRAAVTMGWIDLDAVLGRVAGYFELLAEERGVTLDRSLHSAAGVPRLVWADETMLIRALSNLVSNALRYAPRGTSIRLEATVEATRACTIDVSNDGPSIAETDQHRIFERFYQADPSRRSSASGSGLGLAIVRSIMELHRGRATVRSSPRQRTVFSLYFPSGDSVHPPSPLASE